MPPVVLRAGRPCDSSTSSCRTPTSSCRCQPDGGPAWHSDPSTGPEMLAALTPEQMAEAMDESTFTPPRKASDPEVEALAVTFAHADGVKVLHETIQYLVERSKDEEGWLSSLAEADFPRNFIWGVYDTVSPPRVAAYVWHQYLMLNGSAIASTSSPMPTTTCSATGRARSWKCSSMLSNRPTIRRPARSTRSWPPPVRRCLPGAVGQCGGPPPCRGICRHGLRNAKPPEGDTERRFSSCR